MNDAELIKRIKGSSNEELGRMKEMMLEAIALDPEHESVGSILEWMSEIDDEIDLRKSFGF